MSNKKTILLTKDNEHWYADCSEQVQAQDVITIEFSKQNIRIDLNNDEDLIISIINPESEIYKILSNFKNSSDES